MQRRDLLLTTRSGRLFLVAVAILLASLVLPSVALAQGESGNVCVRDYRGGAVCTANDVRIEALTVTSVVEDCVSGTPGETEVVFETLVSSAGSPNRYDIGLFLALDGGSARDGDSCYHDFLSGPLTATPTYVEEDPMVNGPGPLGEETIIDGPWWDGAGDGDLCGDIESNSRLRKTLPPLRFACIDNNGDGSADVSVCTSWDNNVGSTCNTVVDAFPGTNSKCSCSGVELGIAPEPAITIVKSPALQNVPSGGTANFSFTVTSKTTISNVVVSDPDCDAAPAFTGGDTNGDSILTPDETWTYTCSKTGVMADFMNTVTVTGDGPLGPVNDTGTANVVVASASMTLAKSGSLNDANMDGFAQVGETISYSFTVTNTGTLALTNVAVTDPMVSPITCPSGNPIPSLGVGTMETCTGTYTIVQADVDAGQKVNTATATSNETPPVMDTTTVLLPAPGMTLVKAGSWNDANIDGVAQAGETISYSFTVTNTGTIALTNVAVTDPMVSPIICPSGNPIPSLGVGVMETCTGTYTIVQADVDAGQKVNTATATSNETPPVMDTTTVSLPGPVQSPAIGVAKQVLGEVVAGPGADEYDVTFQILVENLGTVDLSNVQVTDDLAATFPAPAAFTVLAAPATTGTLAANAAFDGAVDTNLLNAAGSTLAVGATGTITFTVRITVVSPPATPFLNTAVASGQTPTGAMVTDTSDDGLDPDPNGNGTGDETGENDPTPIVLAARSVLEIPTLSEWAMMLLMLLLATSGLFLVGRLRL